MMTFRFWLLLFLNWSLLEQTSIEAASVTNDHPAHVVFVIGENEYHTWETLPEFASRELTPLGFNCSFVSASTNPNDSAFSNIDAIKNADLLVLSVRRRALPTNMMNLLRAHLKTGKPLVGIRTASHGFAPKTVELGQAAWPEFDVEILGCSYHGHYSNEGDKPPRIQVVSSSHPILAGIATNELTNTGSLYKIRAVAPGAVPLMTSQLDNSSEVHPVALVNTNDNRRIFYTSLGTRDDFKQPSFRRLLLNAIYWSMARPIPEAKR